MVQARARAEALQARWIGWQILGALGELEEEAGHGQAATELFDKPRGLIVFIAEQARSELRESFLSLPHVRKVRRRR